jgi:hypothetical protein
MWKEIIISMTQAEEVKDESCRNLRYAKALNDLGHGSPEISTVDLIWSISEFRELRDSRQLTAGNREMRNCDLIAVVDQRERSGPLI